MTIDDLLEEFCYKWEHRYWAMTERGPGIKGIFVFLRCEE